MTLEQYERAQRIRADIGELYDLLGVFKNYHVGHDYNSIALVREGSRTNTAHIDAKMRGKLVDLVESEIRELEKKFEDM